MNKQEKNYEEVLKKLKNNEKVSVYKVIRNYCLECQGFQEAEVKRCEMDCVFHKYRMGKNPFPRKLSEETKIKLRERLTKMRKNK